MLVLIGLTVGRLLGWIWLDPVMGIVGMLVIANWSWNLIRASGAVLLDMRTGDGIASEIKHRLEAEREDRVSDLHVWRVGPGHCAAVVSLVSDQPEPPASYKSRLVGIPGLSHVTAEVQPCPGDHRAACLRRPKPVYSGQSCVLLGQNRWIAVPGLTRPRLPTTANRSALRGRPLSFASRRRADHSTHHRPIAAEPGGRERTQSVHSRVADRTLRC